MSQSTHTVQLDVGLHATRNHIPLIARILLSALFLWSGVSKILAPVGTQEYMTAYGMPLTQLFLIGAIALELLAGLSLLLGYKMQLGAIALIAFTVVATLIFHTDLSDYIQQIMLMKNLAIIGGLLMVVQFGGGNVALRS
ncbi:MAG: DoxX family protein [Elainellaceae cyanobacterium]